MPHSPSQAVCSTSGRGDWLPQPPPGWSACPELPPVLWPPSLLLHASLPMTSWPEGWRLCLAACSPQQTPNLPGVGNHQGIVLLHFAFCCCILNWVKLLYRNFKPLSLFAWQKYHISCQETPPWILWLVQQPKVLQCFCPTSEVQRR